MSTETERAAQAEEAAPAAADASLPDVATDGPVTGGDTTTPGADRPEDEVDEASRADTPASGGGSGAGGRAERPGQAVPGSFGGVRRPGAWGAVAWTGRETVGWARWCWRQLTSMRVALILLFLLSLAAVPGSLVPQNGVDPFEVQRFKARHETLAPIYEKLQLFDVYSSVWFSAVYLLLFVSLIGCIVPRTRQFLRQLRSQPPAAPRRLTRLPAHVGWHTDADRLLVLRAARDQLRRRRFRVRVAADSIAAEKGYLREAGNLAFHLALIVLLLAFAAGQLWKSEGGKLVVKGDGFANTLTQYDDFRSGTFFDTGDLDPFGFRLDDFHARYETSGPQRGTAREFRADITYWEGPDGAERETSIDVNHPLEIGDSKVHLLSHGYAPVVSVTDGQGDLAYRGPVPFLPQDNNLTSSGVIKVTDYRDREGEPEQLGFQGFFVPTYGGSGSGTMFSRFPALVYPVLFLTAYHGDLGLDAGLPQNVYQLDTDDMEQFTKPNGDPLAQMLRPGETMELPDGAGTLKFEGVEQWASFQISSQPGNGWALAGALTAVLGLAASLLIQRRRVWVRVRTREGADGVARTVVEMGALGRTESAKVPGELAELAAALQRTAPPAPDATPDETESDTTGPEEAASDEATGDDAEADPDQAAGDDTEPHQTTPRRDTPDTSRRHTPAEDRTPAEPGATADTDSDSAEGAGK